MKKILGPILLIILVIGVAAGIYFSVSEQFATNSIVTIRGVIGSEKEAFFKDPRVIEQLRKANLDVQVEKAGSRQIAAQLYQGSYDFASPSGIPSAEKIRRDHPDSQSFEIFFTPMVIASWQPIATMLEQNGIAKQQDNVYFFNLQSFLKLTTEGKRWTDLKINDKYAVNKSILIASTDVRSSNSAAMYLSLASYVFNGNNMVQNINDLPAAIQKSLAELYLKQGFQAGSSAVPFNDYLTMGIGKAPLVMIYESQFIYQAATAGIKPDMVLLYPEPTLYTKHFIISLNESGEKLGKLLRNDPELQSDPTLQQAATALQHLAIEHGFRNSDTVYFNDFTKQHNVIVADSLVNVIDPPTYEVLEALIQYIEQQY